MIHGTPKVMHLAINLNKYLIQKPPPVRVCAHLLNSFAADFSSEHRAKSIPLIPHRFVADVDAALVQKILDNTKRKRKSDVHHDRQADDLGAAVKALERVWFCHEQRLRNHPARFTQICLTRPSSQFPLTTPFHPIQIGFVCQHHQNNSGNA